MEQIAQEEISEDRNPRNRKDIGLTRNERAMKRQGKGPVADNGGGPELSFGDIGTMVGVALLFDLGSGALGLIPIFGDAIAWVTVDLLGFMTLTFMFHEYGIKFRSGKKKTALIAPFLLKFIPLASIFPDFTLDVITVCIFEKREQAARRRENTNSRA